MANELVPLAHIPRLLGLPIDGRDLRRWADDGLIGPDGERHKLPVVRLGGRFYVRPAHARKFLAKFNGNVDPVAQVLEPAGI